MFVKESITTSPKFRFDGFCSALLQAKFIYPIKLSKLHCMHAAQSLETGTHISHDVCSIVA